jgi:hypothetical protein
MTDTLPPLPEPFMELHRDVVPVVYDGWAEQMRAYALAAVQAERERCAKPLTEDQILALKIMLSHYGDDPRVQCLKELLTNASN